MSNIILHIKDSYYFEIPKMLWRGNAKSASDLPAWLVRLDDDYQSYEADATIAGLKEMGVPEANLSGLKAQWTEWKHSGKNHEHTVGRLMLISTSKLSI